MRTRSVSFCSGSLMLEGRLAEPESTVSGGVVLCHPHTMYAGSMSSALLPPLQRALTHAGFLTLRFNFRGAGRSEGTYDEGRGEVDDAIAAIAFVVADLPAAAPIVVAGWSFGSVVGLHAAVRHPRVVAAVAIAPPMSGGTHGLSPEPPTPEALCSWGRPLLVIGGERDTVAPVGPVRPWAEAAHAELVVIPDADHYFREQDALVAEAIVAFLRDHGVG